MRIAAIAIGAVVATLLCGCAKTPFPVIEAKLVALKGHPIKEVVDKLGEPTSIQSGPEKTYVWSLPSYGGEAVGFECTVTIVTDRADKIARYDFSGNVGGCGYYAHQLDDSYHRAHGILD